MFRTTLIVPFLLTPALKTLVALIFTWRSSLILWVRLWSCWHVVWSWFEWSKSDCVMFVLELLFYDSSSTDSFSLLVLTRLITILLWCFIWCFVSSVRSVCFYRNFVVFREPMILIMFEYLSIFFWPISRSLTNFTFPKNLFILWELKIYETKSFDFYQRLILIT